MPKWKVFLTMEFEAEVEADDEDSARDDLANFIVDGYEPFHQRNIENVRLKRYWGGADEVKTD